MITRRLLRTAPVVVAFAAVAMSAGPAAAKTPPPGPAGADPAARRATAPCDPTGPTALDGQLASQLNSQLQAKMRGYMTAYRVSCARMVVRAVQARGLHSRAAVIAITTTIVESSIDNISEEVDHDSLGLFQQRASWGTAAQRLDPTWATNAFLDKMLRVYPNNAWMTAPIGEVCQAVQVSAYPERYQPQAGDAQIIVNALWPGTGDDLNLDGRDDILSVYHDGTLAYYPNNSSSGGVHFLSARNIGNAPGFKIMAIGDVNVDGRTDILSVYHDGTLAYYPNNSSSGSVHFLSARNIGNAPGFRLLAMGDVNVDGRKDMLAVYTDGTLAYYPNNSSSSGVHFLSARGIGNAPGFKMMTMGDVNADGKEDILAVYTDGTLVYYPNNSSSSGVHFLAARNIGNAPGFRLLAMGDVNVDGRADMLAVYTDGTLAYYPNNSSSSGVHFLAARNIGNAPAFRLMDI